MLYGCGLMTKDSTDEEAAETQEKQKDDVNPLSMFEDFEIVPEKYPLIALIDTTMNTGGDDINLINDSAKTITGMYETYRIQLFTSKTYGPAAREREIATEVFDKDIYLDYEVPYYKVRAGDFYTSTEAEVYLPAAVEAGYKNAWVVKVTINVQKLEELYDENIPPLIDPADTGAIIPEQIYDSPEYPEN
jgi:hypothetical protein